MNSSSRIARPVAALITAVFAAAALAACGAGAGEPPSGVRLLVTDEFGAKVVGAPDPPRVEGQDTAMRLLQRNIATETKFGGGFVSALGGLEGAADAAVPVDWFFFANGVISDRGAAGWRLRDGDAIWWDRHRWDKARVAVVVGQFPEPMRSGSGGKYKGARLICGGAQRGCKLVRSQLTEAGVSVVDQPSPHGRKQTEVLVGPWPEIRRKLPEVKALERGPRVSGVYAKLSHEGKVTAIEADGKPAPTAAGSGLIAVVRRVGGPPVWVITGPTESVVRRTARKLDDASLKGHFATLVERGKPKPLPVRERAAE